MFALLLFLCAGLTARQIGQARVTRGIRQRASGAQRISPDVALLSGAAFADLRDLRLFDSQQHEVPYLLIHPEPNEARWKAGKILPVAATKVSSGFEVDLGSLDSINSLRISGISAPFLKRFQLEGSGDRSHWTLLTAEGTLFDLPAENLRQVETNFMAGQFRYLRLTWNDQNSGVVSLPESAAARIVENREAPSALRASAEFSRLATGPGYSRFRVPLPGSHLPLSAVELQVNESRLLRPARVIESRLSNGVVTSETLGAATLRRVVQDSVVASNLRIPIRAPQGREIEILIEDSSNPQLNLTQVTLEFSPQPWIYFESVSGGLFARYGDPKAVAPRYDLEAIRREIHMKNIPEAQWEPPMKGNAPDVNMPTAAIPPGAAIDRSAFRFARQIPSSASGLTTLMLDVHVLANSRPDLADLRIADSGGRQVQFLLEKTSDVIAIPLTLIPQPSSSGTSRYQVVLPEARLADAGIVLTTKARTFQREVSVLVSRGGERTRDSDGWSTLARDVWRSDDPQSEAAPLTLKLPGRLPDREIIVAVDEGDNQPLPIELARLELPLNRLRFFYPESGGLTLLYGQENLRFPQYDLTLLASSLIGMPSRELTLPAQGEVPVARSSLETRLFWAALIVAVLVILGLLAKLLKAQTLRAH